MSFFPTPPVYWGIDANEKATHVAQVRKLRKGWEVVSLKTFSPCEPVNPLDMGVVVSSLPSRETLVRTCELQIKREKDLNAALTFQLEPQLPYSADNAIIQSQTIEKKVDGTLLTAFAVRKDHLKIHLEALNKKGIEPEKTTSTPYALAALTTLFPQTLYPQFLVYEGEEEVSCILVERGKLLAARAFDHKRDLGREIQKTILSFSSAYKTKEFETILLIGKQSSLIQEATGKMVLFPSTSTLFLSQEELTRYGLAIGIALAADGIDFRQKEFAYPHQWRRIKKPLIACVALSILLVGSLCAFGQIALTHQKKSVEHAYLSLLKTEGKEAKIPYDYHSTLSALEKEVRARPNTHPLLPNVPKVRELLTWLSTKQAIEIESLHYTMVKRPDFSRKNERYKVKVDLEFSSKDNSSASAFHDLLVSPCKFVDSEEEVQWSAGKGKYRTSFYLKDKTRYSE